VTIIAATADGPHLAWRVERSGSSATTRSYVGFLGGGELPALATENDWQLSGTTGTAG
jgi:hypothetical protein